MSDVCSRTFAYKKCKFYSNRKQLPYHDGCGQSCFLFLRDFLPNENSESKVFFQLLTIFKNNFMHQILVKKNIYAHKYHIFSKCGILRHKMCTFLHSWQATLAKKYTLYVCLLAPFLKPCKKVLFIFLLRNCILSLNLKKTLLDFCYFLGTVDPKSSLYSQHIFNVALLPFPRFRSYSHISKIRCFEPFQTCHDLSLIWFDKTQEYGGSGKAYYIYSYQYFYLIVHPNLGILLMRLLLILYWMICWIPNRLCNDG